MTKIELTINDVTQVIQLFAPYDMKRLKHIARAPELTGDDRKIYDTINDILIKCFWVGYMHTIKEDQE